MYFIVLALLGGESVSTNKIGHSDTVASMSKSVNGYMYGYCGSLTVSYSRKYYMVL